MTRDEMTLAEWLDAHAGVVEAGIIQGDLCSRDFARYDVRKIREAAKLLAERDALAAENATLREVHRRELGAEAWKRDWQQLEVEALRRQVAALASDDVTKAIARIAELDMRPCDLDAIAPSEEAALRHLLDVVNPVAAPSPDPVSPQGAHEP